MNDSASPSKLKKVTIRVRTYIYTIVDVHTYVHAAVEGHVDVHVEIHV